MSSSVRIRGSLRGNDTVDATIPLINHSGWYWRQTSPLFNPFVTEEKALGAGRYHVAGEDAVWYGAPCETGVWAELERHSSIDTEYIIRYLSQVHVRDVRIVDLTDEKVRQELGHFTWEELQSDDLMLCQQISRHVLASPKVDGILAPSAALEGHSILVLRRTVLYGDRRRLTEHCRRIGIPSSLLERIRGQVRKITLY